MIENSVCRIAIATATILASTLVQWGCFVPAVRAAATCQLPEREAIEKENLLREVLEGKSGAKNRYEKLVK